MEDVCDESVPTSEVDDICAEADALGALCPQARELYERHLTQQSQRGKLEEIALHFVDHGRELSRLMPSPLFLMPSSLFWVRPSKLFWCRLPSAH